MRAGFSRIIWVCLAGAALCALAAAASDRPTVTDLYVDVVRDSAVELLVVAEDSAIDPLAPDAHALRLVLLDGPTHGILIGDLDHPAVEPPHRAVFSLSYVPAAGFIGEDAVTMVAVDGYGNASLPASIELQVLAERPIGRLSGAWDAEWTVDVQTAAITAFSQRLTEVYRVGSFVLKGIAEFQMMSSGGPLEVLFDALRFESEFGVGAVRAKATVAFDPKKGAGPDLFDYLLTRAGADVFGVSFDHALFLTRPQTESYQTLAISGTVGGVALSGTTRFDLGADCGFAFSRSDIAATWTWCDATLRASAALTGAGFQSATLSALEIPVPRTSWLPGDVTADVALTFRPSEKSVAVGLDWDPGIVGCAGILGELSTGIGVGSIDRALIYGLLFECNVTPAVRVRSATSLEPSKNSAVTGQVDYFELISVSGDLASCCGIPGAWSVATYFRTGSLQLFDWGMTVLKADVGVSEHWSLRLDVALRSGELGDPVSEFTIGWTARW